MKRPGTMMFNIVAFLVMLLSFSLFFMGSYPLSIGSSYLLAGRSGTFTSIVSLVGGSLLELADLFLIFFVYLPLQKEERLEVLRGIMSKARDKASEKQEHFSKDWQGYKEDRMNRRGKGQTMKMTGTRLTFSAALLALLFGIAIFLVEISIPHMNPSVHGFVSFTVAGAFF